MSLLTSELLKTHRTVQLPMINAPTNAIDGGPHPLFAVGKIYSVTTKVNYKKMYNIIANEGK